MPGNPQTIPLWESNLYANGTIVVIDDEIALEREELVYKAGIDDAFFDPSDNSPLDLISFDAYNGESKFWHVIAEQNNIDKPWENTDTLPILIIPNLSNLFIQNGL